VSVKDFGAVGDGVADDTAAVQAAINSLSAGDELLLPAGYTYRVVNATGTGATLVLQRANAVANNTLYAISSSTNNISIRIDGDVVSTSALDDVFRFTGSNVTVHGSGSVTGPGIYLDTNSSDPLLQWYPSLIKLSGDGSSCAGLNVVNAPTIGIYLDSSYSKAISNHISGGPTSHGAGTVSFGICCGNASGGDIYNAVVDNNFYPGSDGGAMYDAVYSVCTSAVISNNNGYGLLEHGIYNYGAYSVISSNRFGGSAASPMTAPGIQSFASNCTITSNILSGSIGGIAIASCSNTVVAENIISGNITQGGISVRRYTSDATSTTYRNITISNNAIYVPGVTQQAIDVALDNNLTGLSISGNSITGSAATYGAIVVRNAGSGTLDQIKITGNYIEQCNAYGIETNGISGFLVSENQILNANATASDIAIYANTNCVSGTIKNNTVSDTRGTKLTARVFYGSGAGNNYLVVNDNTANGLLSTTNAFVQLPATGGYKYGNRVDGNPTVGTFTVTNATGGAVTAPTQTAYGGGTTILIIPINQAAWDLQAGVNRIYVSGVNAGSFNWATSSGAATGSTTASFQYQIMQ
jgi:parallel beta-helix repeat protein